MPVIELEPQGPDGYAYRPPAPDPRLPRLFARLDVVKGVIAAAMAFYLATLLLGGPEDEGVLVALGANFGPGVGRGEAWRFLSSVFLHGNLLHLAVNMYSFWILGRLVEKIHGRARLAGVFLACGALAAAASAAANPAISVGSSGGITGLLGFMLAFTLRFRERLNRRFVNSFLVNLGVIVLINLVLGMLVPNIDQWAHLAGFAAGMALGWLAWPGTLFGERDGGRRAARTGLAMLVLLAAAWAGLAWHLATALVLPDRAGTRAFTTADARHGWTYPRAFFAERGAGGAGYYLFTNYYDVVLAVAPLDADGAAARLAEWRRAGDVAGAFVNGREAWRTAGRIPGTGEPWAGILVAGPADAAGRRQYVELRVSGRGRALADRHRRILQATAESLAFEAAGVI